jgi:basic membrane protein A
VIRPWALLGTLVVANAALLWPTGGGEGAVVAKSQSARGAQGATRPLRVGLVFDVGGRGDKSFNDMAYAGVERARRELGISPEYVEPGDGADRESGIRLFAARGFDLVVGVGFIFSDDLYSVAKEYPKVRFACVDYAKFDANGFVVPPPNMVAVKFREEEGAFLVGALAALLSSTTTLGFVGGMDIPLIRKFEAGYRAGAQYVCPGCRVLAGYAGTSGDAFKNPQKGKELGLAQYGAGASAIFHAAGTTGLGVFEAARELHRYAIGVDADQYGEAPGRILTSMTKNIDVALFELVRELTQGRWQGGLKVFGLKEKAIDYVYDEHNRALIPDDVRARVEALRAEIIAGKIVPPTEPPR